jgi:hypothetical protein
MATLTVDKTESSRNLYKMIGIVNKLVPFFKGKANISMNFEGFDRGLERNIIQSFSE